MKVIQNKSIRIITISLLGLTTILLTNYVHATNSQSVNYQVNVAPTLNLEVTSNGAATNNITLNLDPNSKTFDSQSIDIKVSTNNVTGYNLSMTTSDGTTNLTRDNSSDGVNATINTLPTLAGGYDENSFITNKWGFKVSASDTNPSKVTTNYFPFAADPNLAVNHYATNSDTTSLTFAAKIDWNQPAGTYENTLVFNAVATYAAYTINYYDGVNNTSGNEIATQENDYNTSSNIVLTPKDSQGNPIATPTRATYAFMGWCDQIPTADSDGYLATVCPTGHRYSTGDTITIDPTAYNTNINLYAYWDPTTFAEAYQVAGRTVVSYGGANYYTMQDMSTSICSSVTDGQTSRLLDNRVPNNSVTTKYAYTIAKINENCWMTKNLLFGYGQTSITLNSSTSNSSTKTISTIYDLATQGASGGNCWGDSSGSGNGYLLPCTHGGTDNSGVYTVWYNYVTATAGTITGPSNNNVATEDICPANWRLPTGVDIRTINNLNKFNLVTGGVYTGGQLTLTHLGYWWLNTLDTATGTSYRGAASTNGSYLSGADHGQRTLGMWIRCIAQN